jgi:hypothetical protein
MLRYVEQKRRRSNDPGEYAFLSNGSDTMKCAWAYGFTVCDEVLMGAHKRAGTRPTPYVSLTNPRTKACIQRAQEWPGIFNIKVGMGRVQGGGAKQWEFSFVRSM